MWPVLRERRRWEDNIKRDAGKIEYVDGSWMELDQFHISYPVAGFGIEVLDLLPLIPEMQRFY
jgi:hypothetical protein